MDKLKQLTAKKQELDKVRPLPPELVKNLKKSNSGKLLKIGELAKMTNETVPTIRFWTREGLLNVKSYTESGYQLYEFTMVNRAYEIRRLQKEKRFTLQEIKQKLN